jgi:hypothetical protein
MAGGDRVRSVAATSAPTRQATPPLKELSDARLARVRERPTPMDSGSLGWRFASSPSPGRSVTAARITALLGMQQTVGNRAVQRVLQRAVVQPAAAAGGSRREPDQRRPLVPAAQRRAVQRDDEPTPAPKPKKAVTGTALGRLAHARAAIAHTKGVLSFGAGDQREALKATNFNAYFRTAAMRDDECWELAPSVQEIADSNPEALVAAKADLMHGGNAGEHAWIAFAYLRAHAVGETIVLAHAAGFDHPFVLIGDPTEPADDVAVADPWPTRATACTWKDHFAYQSDPAKVMRRHAITADGKNVTAVIAAGLRLSAKGRRLATEKLSKEETHKRLEQGRDWIWNHDHTTSVEYDDVPQERRRR